MNTTIVSSKILKTRTSITLTPEILEFVKNYADDNKISVSQLIENYLIDLKNKAESK